MTKQKKTTEAILADYINGYMEEVLSPYANDEGNKEVPVEWFSGLLNGTRGIAPISGSTLKEYGFSNAFTCILSAWARKARMEREGLDAGECSYEYLTFKQITALGGKVKKGEHGVPIVFFTEWDKVQKCRPNAESEREDIVRVMRYYLVFDIATQVEGISPRRVIKTKENTPLVQIDTYVKKFAEETNLKLEIGKVSGAGSYSPSQHTVSVAGLQYYDSPEAYYSTLFHECIHSTAEALGRDISGNFFGNKNYSEEEIVAECGAMILCQRFGIHDIPCKNSLEYLRSWSKKLRENPSWLSKGISKATKAVTYFLEKAGVPAEVEENETEVASA
jgi:hypothetical protein